MAAAPSSNPSRESQDDMNSPSADAPQISVIIPAYNASRYLRACLDRLSKSTIAYECIVIDDGSTDDTPQVARFFGATLLSSGKRSGPAHARNIGAHHAKAPILFFIDADVCVRPGTLQRILDDFQEEPQADAIIGSYDDSPESKDFLSQYRNLMHCYTHQKGRRQASTFWSGCGAIRRTVFLDNSGFDEGYNRPAIEDIELGYRLKHQGRQIILDPGLQVKHLKEWSFLGLVRTDIFDRGIPWTELILRDRNLPNDLNLQLSQRVSVALVYLLLFLAACGSLYVGATFILPLLALLFLTLSAYEAESMSPTNPRAMAGTILLGLAIVIGAVWSKNYWLAPPVLLAYLLLFIRHRYYYTTERRRRATGIFCGLYLGMVILFVLTYLPNHPIVLGFFLILSVVVILNSQFYVFLAGRTGRLLALAAIPFHLLFHFYNGVSFAVGMANHTLSKFRSRRETVEKSNAAASANR